VLLSGDHAKIAQWRREEALRITLARRPGLQAKERANQSAGGADRRIQANPPTE